MKRIKAIADSHGVSLRPHTKMHKCLEITKLHLNPCASEIYAQKLGGADPMLEAGVKDVFITTEIVQPTRINRLVKLQERASVKIAVDSFENPEQVGGSLSFVTATLKSEYENLPEDKATLQKPSLIMYSAAPQERIYTVLGA